MIIRPYKLFIFSLFILRLFLPSPAEAARPVRVGLYQNAPLAFVEENGKVTGFFIDILEFISAKEGWKIEYVHSSFPECFEDLKNGRIDLLGVIASSDSRRKIFDYTFESIFTNWGQMYINNKSDVESILDLQGKKVAVLQGDIYFINLRKLVNQFGIQCRFIEAFEYEDVLKLVEIGRCQAGLVNQVYGLQHERDYDILKSSIVLSPQKIYWAVPAGKNRDLLFALDQHIRKLKNDEKSIYYQSINKWFGIGSKSLFPMWLKWVAAGTVALLSLSLVISIISRAQVKSKTKALTAEIEHRKQSEKERAHLESILLRAQKMEALGTLAGGVAHDLNNILSGIVSYPELLLMDIPNDSPMRKPILTIKESGEKAAMIVQDLLTLARRGLPITEVVNLNNIIKEQLESPEIRKLKSYYPDIRLKTEFDKNLLNIVGSPIHLSKTIMNLISNASEAMLSGGEIFISTENRYIDMPIKGYDDIEEGDYIVLTISDLGIGISNEDMEHIFEPFYTKKAMGRSGTGLGMAVVWGTVKDHQGYIDVQSKEDQGSRFTLYFPVTREELPVAEKDLSLQDFMGMGESVLVVDDVAEQREIASALLTKLGYSVATASSGEDAIEYMQKNTADILVLDMIMAPGMDGLDTYKKIIAFKPGQKAIIASGFSETARVKEAQRLGAGSYVRKPYTIEKIGLALKTELHT
jgi:signal transduction histidine kinase